MNNYSDQTGKIVSIPYPPQRIVSLVPSQTALLHALGLDNEVVGITKFCIHPNHWYRSKPHIGGTKNVNIARLQQLQPDLVIANKEENVKEQVHAIESFCPVWTSDIKNLEDALQMIAQIAGITGTVEKGRQICKNIEEAFATLTVPAQPLSTAYLIWKDPYMTVGGDTFISHMMQRAGLQNVFADTQRYPAIAIEDLIQRQCKLVLLSSEPYPFREKHIKELQQVLPDVKMMLVNGEMFSWYGSSLLHAPAYFRQLLAELA